MADHKETIRRLFDEVVNHGKLEVVDDLVDPEFETRAPDGTFDREGFKAYVVGWRAAFADVNCEVGDLIAEGDTAAWSIRATGTHTGDLMGLAPTGRTVDFDSLNMAHFRDGRLYRHTVLMDTQTLMSQLGQGPA